MDAYDVMDQGPARWRGRVRVVALAGPFLVCAALSVVRDQISAAIAALVLVLLVVAAAAVGDRTAAVMAAGSGGVWFDFFLVAPFHRFTIDRQEDTETVVLLVLIGLAVAEIAIWGRRQQAWASRRSGYLEGMVEVASSISENAMPFQAVTDVVGRQITHVLGVDTYRYVDGPPRDPRMAVLAHDGVLTRRGRPIDVDAVGLPTDEYVVIPATRGSQCVGHFVLTAAARTVYPTAEQRRVAVLLADQAAVARTSPSQPASTDTA